MASGASLDAHLRVMRPLANVYTMCAGLDSIFVLLHYVRQQQLIDDEPPCSGHLHSMILVTSIVAIVVIGP
jgi:hypothetical protein